MTSKRVRPIHRRWVIVIVLLAASVAVGGAATNVTQAAAERQPCDGADRLQGVAAPLGLGGALTNWDVYNNCTVGDASQQASNAALRGSADTDAYAFTWTLGDLAVADIDSTYVGEHPFADGALGGTPEPSVPGDHGSDATIRWENTANTVGAGEKAHFGFDVQQPVTDDPSSIGSRWSLIGGGECEIPQALLSWYHVMGYDDALSFRPAQEGRQFSARITNHSEQDLLIQRRVKNLAQPGFALTDLNAASTLIENVQVLDPDPVLLQVGDRIEHVFAEAEGDTGLLVVFDVSRVDDGAPLFTGYHAVKLPQPMPTATATETELPATDTSTPQPETTATRTPTASPEPSRTQPPPPTTSPDPAVPDVFLPWSRRGLPHAD